MNVDVRDVLPVHKWREGQPWEKAAAGCVDRGHYRLILGRNDSGLYLARFWLSQPKPHKRGWESGESMLLHFIVRPDDDGALHDHPWSFHSRILSGGYTEEVPHRDWLCGARAVGPTGDQIIEQHWSCLDGRVNKKDAEDFHRICHVSPNTWSLVMTGLRGRKWGFMAPGQPWKKWDEYLGYAESEEDY